MTYSDYSISYEEFQDFISGKSDSPKITAIWNDLISRLKDIDCHDLADEAKEKGFSIVSNPDMEDDVVAEYKMFNIPDASEELEEAFNTKLYPYIVCLKI